MAILRLSVGPLFVSDAGTQLVERRKRGAGARLGLAGLVFGLALGVALGVAEGRAQQEIPPASSAGSLGPANSRMADKGMGSSITPQMEHHMAERRNEERQKVLVADTDRLLALAQELKTEVDKSGKDQLSIDVIRRAEQIEKLAHSVREKMRGY